MKYYRAAYETIISNYLIDSDVSISFIILQSYFPSAIL